LKLNLNLHVDIAEPTNQLKQEHPKKMTLHPLFSGHQTAKKKAKKVQKPAYLNIFSLKLKHQK
jgi:hypothetical protein